MHIKAWYFLSDGSDGSASLRLYADEVRCRSVFENLGYEDNTNHMNDGSIHSIVLDTDDFKELMPFEVPTYKSYNTEVGPEITFDAWYNADEYMHDPEDDLRLQWDKLEAAGIENPGEILDSVISIISAEYGD